MKPIQIIFFILICFSCKSQIQKNRITYSNFEEQLVGENGLITAFKGDWINTSLFDSTLQKRQLNPWLNDFYGDLRLLINDSDSVTIEGNMDGGKGIIKVIDSISFSFPDRIDTPTFTYNPDKDLIILKSGSYKPIVFRRIDKKDNLKIIANEKFFNQYFIDQFFTGYFSDNEKVRIVEIWNGFETYTPFDFDALGIKGKSDKVEYYAWKFIGDTLELYETSFKYDDDSGFAIFKIEKLKKRLTKK